MTHAKINSENLENTLETISKAIGHIVGSSYKEGVADPLVAELKATHGQLARALQAHQAVSTTRHSFFLCAVCGADWDAFTGADTSVTCSSCKTQGVTPYYSCGIDSSPEVAGEIDPVELAKALEIAERAAPSGSREGVYEITLTRSSIATRTLQVASTGPGAAQVLGLERAKNLDFGCGGDYEYGIAACRKLAVEIVNGKRYFWADPQRNEARDLSCEVVVEAGRPDKSLFFCRSVEGHCVEARPAELMPIGAR